MASARARLSGAMRNVGKRQRKFGTLQNILGTASTITAFAGSQIDKANTAWDEYESGYKDLTGEDYNPDTSDKSWFDKQKDYWKGPEGDVVIGSGKDEYTYNMEDIRSHGSFVKSMKDNPMWSMKYDDDKSWGDVALERQRENIKREFTGADESLGVDFNKKSRGLIGMAEGNESLLSSGGKYGKKGLKERMEDGNKYSGNLVSPDFLKNYQADLDNIGSNISKRDAKKTDKILSKQRKNYSGVDEDSLRGSELSGSAYDKLVRDRQFQYAKDMYDPIKSMMRPIVDPTDLTPKKVQASPQIPELLPPTYGMSSEERGRRKAQEKEWDAAKIQATSYDFRNSMSSPFNNALESWEEGIK